MIHVFTRVFHKSLNLNIFSQKHIFATYDCTRAHFMSLLIATINTLIVMINLFFNQNHIFATYACTKEHFMSLLRAFP